MLGLKESYVYALRLSGQKDSEVINSQTPLYYLGFAFIVRESKETS